MVEKAGSRLTTITAAIRAAAQKECFSALAEQRASSARSLAKKAAGRADETGRGDLVRMDVVRWDAGTRARFARMIECARYNLNGSADNAFAEALALAHLHRHGDVVPERDLLRCAGFGAQVPGTPDGAVVLAHGQMAAVQVVRAPAPRGARGVAALMRVCLAKVHRSLRWLLESGLGTGVCAFTIACWLPRRLSNRALAALRAGFAQCAAAIDPRFEIVLLAPPADARARIFPPLFGELRRDEVARDEADVGELLLDIRGFCAAWVNSSLAPNEEVSHLLGFLADMLSS